MIFGVRRWPIFATLIVVAAAAVMAMLGFWQLDRLAEKEAMLADYAQAQTVSSDVPWPGDDPQAIADALYRHTRIACRSTFGDWQSIAGRNDRDQTGYVHLIRCQMAQGGSAWVQAGWTPGPNPPRWDGGEVGGFVARYPAGAAAGTGGAKLVANPPLAGLGANAVPNPADIPNNHLAYAVQWFLFAATALVIFVLALRRKQRES